MPAPAPIFLTARWIHLAMLNYEVEPSILQDLVPSGTELDLWHGRCFVSVVGFQFLDTRVLGVGVPFHRDFAEVNLRFYVRRQVGPELRRGVVFIKEIVPRALIAWTANLLYGEKYVALPMSHEIQLAADPATVAYRWRHAARECGLALALGGRSYLPEVSSEEAFITEHYWGYARQRNGATLEYQVEHERWEVWKAERPVLSCDVASLYGTRFVPFLNGPASSCFVADGSKVLVRRGVAL